MKLRLLLAVAALLFVVYSCKKSSPGATPTDKPADVTLNVSRANISMGAISGYSDTLVLSASGDWTLSIASGNDWLAIDNLKGGSGKTTLTLSVKQTDSGSTRSALVTVTPAGNASGKPVTFTVAQTTFGLVWQRALGGSKADYGLGIAQTSDGGFVSIGTTQSSDGDVTGNPNGYQLGLVVKVDAAGNKLWQKAVGGSGLQYLYGIVATSDGGVVITGSTTSDNNGDVGALHGPYGLADLWVFKLDASGNFVWNKLYGGSSADEGTQVINTPDGGFLIAGHSSSKDGDVPLNHGGLQDTWLLKLDASGGKQWSKVFGGSDNEYLESVTTSPDGGYMLAVTSSSTDGDIPANKGNYDIYLFKLDVNGNTQWVKDYGGSDVDGMYAITHTPDGGYLITGTSSSNDGDITGNHSGNYDLLLLKVNKDGEKVWVKLLGGTGGEQGFAAAISPDGAAMIAGVTNSIDGDVTLSRHRGGNDFWLVKVDAGGRMLWQNTFGSSGDDEGQAITTTTDGGFVVIGNIGAGDGDVTGGYSGGDAWVFKIK